MRALDERRGFWRRHMSAVCTYGTKLYNDRMNTNSITVSDWAVVVATLFSPVIAVVVTRLMDQLKSRRDRQWSIFETLMLTRRAPLSQDHVMALNRIEIEFAKDSSVMAAIRSYFDNLGEKAPVDTAEFERFQARRRRLFAELVQEIGLRMNHKVDKMDLIEGGYYPAGWEEDEVMRRTNSKLLNDILSGQRPIITSNHVAQTMNNSPYPPPPTN